ncbi:glycosyltransferase family 4 protein [Trichothermofontia sichuanensis B231]|uniref:glycosyltransferase family 4 protein n=1 Tax=Trichothermofontia sichuanensis TaxID=3045816 RepID=UPI002245FC0B|nr:glycosyltransferase family 4 protein [Trichothermofontia sichuanensis]UZQ54799.1 glycosyltransferase family 4 protein [Trichothermofontia sichuanensis B231]
MHIAWLGKKSPFCGNVTYGREVTNTLLERGHQVSFLHFNQETESSEAALVGSDVAIPCLLKSQVYTIPTFRSEKVLTDALRQLRPDVVHASLTLSPLDFRLPEICEALGLPLVATFHPPFDREVRTFTSSTQHLTYQLYAPFLARYDRVIVFSQLQRDVLIRLGVPASRMAVIPNGVDVDKYSPGPSRLKANLQVDRLFVYQGRIAPEKNLGSLLKAWKQAEMGPNCRLLIVGDGPLRPSLEPFYGPEYGIQWLGFEPNEQRRIEILRGADVFVLPSLVEGLSLSLLEAMSCGVACVATDAGADGEVLADQAGVIIQRNQRITAQLQALLPQLRDHPAWTRSLGYHARQRVLERYTLSRNISLLEALYAEVQSSRSLVA